MSPPTTRPPEGPRSVAGQPAPARSTSSAGTRPSRGHRERDREREAEDGGEQHGAHLRVDARVERRLHVVEVAEAAGEARPDRAGQVARMQRRDAVRDPDCGRRRRRRAHAIRAASGRTSAGSTASPATATERSGWLIGLSSRSHAVAITAAGMSAVRSVLGNARLASGERDGEIVAGTHDGDRDRRRRAGAAAAARGRARSRRRRVRRRGARARAARAGRRARRRRDDVTTTSSSERAARPPSAWRSANAGVRAFGSAPASTSSARRHSPSEVTGCDSRAAELTTSAHRRPRRRCACRIEPAARTATSKPSPAPPRSSPSSRTATSSRGASSSSFTISRPRRAVERQCTLRSDSPSAYSRTLCSS